MTLLSAAPSFLDLVTLAAANPVEHVINHPFWPPERRFGDGQWWIWSAHMGNLVLSALILIPLMLYVAKCIAPGPESMGNERFIPRNKFAHTIEVICIYLRDVTVRPLLGERTDKFMPFLWTLFFFILVNNLLGLVPLLDLVHMLNSDWRAQHRAPIGGTATQNLFVTGALAVVAALVINIAGVRGLGLGPYVKHLTAGTPAYLWPLMVPLEVLGTFIKPAALAIRLFANMTAGHILLATLFMFVGMGLRSGLLVGVPVGLVSILGGIAILFLEIFIAFLQAFVFMFLTTVFVSMLSPHEHHDHDADHPERPAHHVGDERLLHGAHVPAH
jgi:F-type H+-transporting ATPase subunit a